MNTNNQENNSKVASKSERLKDIRKSNVAQFLNKYGKSLKWSLNKDNKIKLCSSCYFDTTAKVLAEKYKGKETPIIMGHVSGFYETASLAGLIKSNSSKRNEYPFVLFFDREINNIQNAIFNSLLINLSKNKEDFLTSLFGLKPIEILKAFDQKLYLQILKKEIETNFKDKEIVEEEINSFIEKAYIDNDFIETLIKENFTLKKLFSYIKEEKVYNSNEHYQLLLKVAEKSLKGDMLETYKSVASNICNYLGQTNNYKTFADSLSQDMQRNPETHILNNSDIFNGFKSLLTKTGTGSIKFLPGIDVSNPNGLNKLEKILKEENIITTNENSNEFPVDISNIPHIRILKNTYSFFKRITQDYTVIDTNNQKTKSTWNYQPSVTLNIEDHNSMGAQFIKDERDNRIPLTHLEKIDSVKGFPLMTFIAGANYGNIYHSEVDTQNMVDMAIADKVDTVYIQGLFYATYYHHQTSRRLLNDPDYPTLDSKLKTAKQLVKKLNDNGVKVVYQMGDEEIHLYNDMFKVYLREQEVRPNFLTREDLRTRYDWVRPIIIKQLIPYLIRKGEDITSFNNDEVEDTRVSEVCHALKAYNEGTPLGDLEKYIDSKYFEDTNMFKVVFDDVINYDKEDPALSVNLISNPNFSYNTQYGTPAAGINKYTKTFQMGAVDKCPLEELPQLTVDSRQGYMGLEVVDNQTLLTVPQMINDEWYFTQKGLLNGIKEKILEDPTHKRVTQVSTKPNYPGGWTITGDVREIQRIIPYYKRVREVLEHVQKTGEALPELSVLHLNDTQVGSPTERVKYFLKMLDYAFYNYNIRGIWGNGDYQQGWNYPGFALESRHLGSMSVSQQMVDNVKLQKPWMKNAFGVIDPEIIVVDDPNNRIKIDLEKAKTILDYLVSKNVIKIQKGMFGNVYAIDKEIDYKKVDLKLEGETQKYEKHIREKLASIHYLWFYHLVEGNHEYNTDWNQKGYKLTEHLKQDADNMKAFSGSDTEIQFPEYIVNRKGDILRAPYGSKTINGYNIAYGHKFNAAGKGSGRSPVMAMANYFEQMGASSNQFHRAFMGHLHIYSTAVINNMMLSITGCSAGQSGYEQDLGFESKPMFVIDRYMSDGRLVVDTIGTKFLDTWEIKNPEVAAMGLDNFIGQCFTQEAPTYGSVQPEKVQDINVRKLVFPGVNNRIGPKIS